MLASYRFESAYQHPASHLQHLPFRLLEGGIFSPGEFCPVVSLDGEDLRVHFCRWGSPGLGFSKSLRAWISPHAFLHQAIQPEQRCLIPANAYYFRSSDGRTWKVEQQDGSAFCFAGVRFSQPGPDGALTPHVAVLATEATSSLRPFHLLMPAILPPPQEAAWLRKPASASFASLLPAPALPSLSICEVQYLQEMDPQWSHLAA